MNARFFSCALLLVLQTGGCADMGEESPPGRFTTLRARAGELVEVRAYNPGADGGYGWQVTKDFSTAIGAFKEYRIEVGGESTMVGAPVTQIWTYRARSTGTTSLEMSLRRPWESLPGIDHKEFLLVVY